MAKELKVVSYIKGKDGERIPLDSLSDEQRSEYAAKIRESVANSISQYLSEHPEEIPSFIRAAESSREEIQE